MDESTPTEMVQIGPGSAEEVEGDPERAKVHPELVKSPDELATEVAELVEVHDGEGEEEEEEEEENGKDNKEEDDEDDEEGDGEKTRSWNCIVKKSRNCQKKSASVQTQ